MPAQKSQDAAAFAHCHRKRHHVAPEEEEDDDDHEERAQQLQSQQQPQGGGGDGSFSGEDSDAFESEESSEFVYVDLHEIRKEVQCPICLGIIKRTRTVMECLHRFCRQCIDKSMRMGNNECPACRTHCASRRSLRDDPRYDAIIAALFPDIEKYEKEELAFQEEDQTRNKQIQTSIDAVSKRQSEALGKKRAANKDVAGPSVATQTRNFQKSQSKRRKRRRSGANEFQLSDENEDANESDEGRFLSSPDEHDTEAKPRKRKSRNGIGSSHPSSSASNSNVNYIEGSTEQSKDGRCLSPGPVWSAELLAWGKGGARSNNRHGSINSGVKKGTRSTRLAKLVDFLHKLGENDDKYFLS